MEYSKSRNIVLVMLFSVIAILRCLVWLCPSPILMVIMEDMSLNYAQSGLILLIVTVMMGVSLFIGSFIIDKLGASATLAISAVMLGLDGIISFYAPTFGIMMIGRIFAGIGMGLSMGSMNALISERFEAKLQSFMNSLNLILSALGMGLAYMVAVPLTEALGSYQGMFLLWGTLCIAIAIIFFLFDGKQAHNIKKESLPQEKAKAPSLIAAAKFKNVWIIAIAMAGGLWVYNSFSAYLPTFLAQERMMSPEAAGIATSVMQVSGIAGSFLWGLLFTKGASPKGLMLAALTIIFGGALGTSLIPSGAFLYICVFGIGMGYYAFQAAAVTSIMQMPGMLPQMMGGATAIYIGTGSLLGIASSSAFDFLQAEYGMQATMTIFSMVMILSIIAIFTYRSKIRPAI